MSLSGWGLVKHVMSLGFLQQNEDQMSRDQSKEILSLKENIEDLSSEEAWTGFWILFKFDFGMNSLDFQNLHSVLIEKYKKDPTISKKYVSEIDISTGFTVTLGGSLEENHRLLTRTKSAYQHGPQTFRNSISLILDE